MPRSVVELVELLNLELIEDRLFRGRQPDTMLQRVFGGQVLGQALAAAYRTAPSDRAVHSLHAYFLRPGDPAVPLIYDVENLRDGRSFSARRVAARQHGQPIFFLSASFHVHEPGPDHQDVAPDVSRPEALPSFGMHMEQRSTPLAIDVDREWAALEVRHAGASYPGSDLHDPLHPAVARVWMRAAGRLPDDVSRAAPVRARLHERPHPAGREPCPARRRVVGGNPAASLDHAMWFHRPFRADEWLLYDQVSPSASGARGLSIGRIFDQHRNLVATAVQEGLVRPMTA